MTQNDRIAWNVPGQTHSYRVPQGAPSSATFQVFREFATDDATPEFSGTATVDSVANVALTSAAGPAQADPQKVALASTAGMTTSQTYLISEASMQERVAPIEIEAAYVRVRHPVRNSFTTAARLTSTTISLAIDAAFIANRAKINEMPDPNPGYRVRWSIVIGGVTQIAYSYFTVVRAVVPYAVDLNDLDARAPGLADSLPVQYAAEQGRPLLEAAWLSVQARLSAMGLSIDAFRDNQVVDEMVILQALCILAAGGWKPKGYPSLADFIRVRTDEWDRFVDRHLAAAMKHRIAFGIAGGAEKVPAQPAWGK